MSQNKHSQPAFPLNHPLLRGLKPEYLQEMLIASVIEEYDDDNPMIAIEGERADKLYLILEGKIEVFKLDEESQEQFHIRFFDAEDFLGEFALFSEPRRTASLKAVGPTKLLAFPRETLLNSQTRPWFPDFALNLAQGLAKKLDYTSNVTAKALREQLKEIKLREQINRFLLYMLSFLSIYTVLVAFISKNDLSVTQIRTLSNAIAFSILVLGIRFIAKNKMPVQVFGISKPKNWQKDLGEALLASGGLVIATTLLKYGLIQTSPVFAQFPLFHNPFADLPNNLILITIYMLLVPVQELAARGGLQSLFNLFFYDETAMKRHLYAILLSNALFSASHAHLSATFVIITFFPGLIWGLLYARQGSLFGVIISHLIVGVWAIYVLGIFIIIGT